LALVERGIVSELAQRIRVIFLAAGYFNLKGTQTSGDSFRWRPITPLVCRSANRLAFFLP